MPRWARPRTSPGCRPRSAATASAAARTPSTAGRPAAGTASPQTEIKIAAFVEEGLSNPEIAARLMLSRRTVATHVSHILKKLDVNSRIDIARESALRTISSK